MPNLSKMALLFTMGGAAPVGGSPSGNPSNPEISRYGGVDKWRVHWDNSDATAYTRVYHGDIGDSFAESSLLKTELPGVTFSDTGFEAGIPEPPPPGNQHVFWLVHYKNGQESDTPISINTTGF